MSLVNQCDSACKQSMKKVRREDDQIDSASFWISAIALIKTNKKIGDVGSRYLTRKYF